MTSEDSTSSLLLRLSGPMQSWGTSSRFTERDSGLEPSKSGVIGLLCAALGRKRSEDVSDLAALRMGVRVDRAGVLRNDYQTAGGSRAPSHISPADAQNTAPPRQNTGVILADGSPGRAIVSNRAYLADAVFLVGLEARDVEQLREIESAVLAPHWPLFLGRRGYVPSEPIALPGGGVRVGVPLVAALSSEPKVSQTQTRDAMLLRLVIEVEDGGARRMDQPIGAAFRDRTFGPRYVQSLFISVSPPNEEREDSIGI